MAHDLEGDGFSQIVTEPPAPLGHNNPPGLLIGDALIQRVKLTHSKLFTRAADLLAAEARMPKAEDGKTLLCPDEAAEKRMTELSKQLTECQVAMDTARSAEIAPYRSNLNAVHGLFREDMDKMVDPDTKTSNSLKARIGRALTVYKNAQLEKERKRLAEEARLRGIEEEKARVAAQEAQAEADRLAAEAARKRNPEKKAEAQEAAEKARTAADELAGSANTAAESRNSAEAALAAPAAAFTRSRSSNAMSGLQEFVDHRDFNRETIDLEKLRAHIPADAYEQALRSFIRANGDMLKDEIKNKRQPVRGVVFFINQRTQVR